MASYGPSSNSVATTGFGSKAIPPTVDVPIAGAIELLVIRVAEIGLTPIRGMSEKEDDTAITTSSNSPLIDHLSQSRPLISIKNLSAANPPRSSAHKLVSLARMLARYKCRHLLEKEFRYHSLSPFMKNLSRLGRSI